MIKRDGQEFSFDKMKIFHAVRNAGVATKEFGSEESMRLTDEVCKALKKRFGEAVPSIEQIQDEVEKVLIKERHFVTARSYIVYREQHLDLSKGLKTVINVADSIDEYLENRDWRVKANANQGYSLGGLILNISGKVTANYWLNSVYTPEVANAHRTGALHIHDLDLLAGYCAGWSLRTLIQSLIF